MIAPLNVKVLALDAATVPPLAALRLKGFATVMVEVDSKVPPDSVIALVGLFKFVASEMDKTPAPIVVAPL